MVDEAGARTYLCSGSREYDRSLGNIAGPWRRVSTLSFLGRSPYEARGRTGVVSRVRKFLTERLTIFGGGFRQWSHVW